MAIFTGAGVAIVTPFHEDGTVNYEKFAELIEYQIAHKTDAIVVCGREIKVYKEKKPIGKFLDKKRIIIFSLMFIMMIVLVIVTVTFITNVNVHTIISTISKIQNHTNAIIAGWILLLILAGICRYIWQIESIRMRLKHYLVNTSIWE